MNRCKMLAALGLVVSLVGACSSGTDSDAESGSWEPEKDVTVVVPFAPGGGTDSFGRALAEGIEQVRPGVKVTVENREGGSGAVGYSYVYERSGDPHYLLPESTPMIMMPIFQDVPFQWEDWTRIGQVGNEDALLLVKSDAPWKSLDDLVAAAEGADQPITMGLGSVAGVDAVNSYILEEEAGIDFKEVIFDGGSETNTALLAGDIDVSVGNVGDSGQLIEAGDFRALAVLSPERSTNELIAEVPTATEQGFKVDLGTFRGVIAPPGLSEEESQYWTEAIQDWTKTDEFAEFVETQNLSVDQYWGDDWSPRLEMFAEQAEQVAEKTQ